MSVGHKSTSSTSSVGSIDHDSRFSTTVDRSLMPDVRFGAVTHVGKVRQSNEDHYSIVKRTRSREILLTSLAFDSTSLDSDHAYVMIVADGMGGGNCGEVASEMVLRFGWDLVSKQASWLMRFEPSEWPHVQETLKNFAERLQQLLIQHTRLHEETVGMGTTWTCAYIVGWHVIIAHVGDSRAYLHRKGELRHLTKDHTVAQQLVDHGVSPENSRRFRHILTNAFGCENDVVRVESSYYQLSPGDQLLLCTDGLYDMVSDAEIAEQLQTRDSPQALCESLRDQALAAGGRDNISVLLADFQVNSLVSSAKPQSRP